MVASKKNRSTQDNIVQKYVRMMQMGTWYLSPAAISFDVNGRLVDGHHRLQAVILSGCTVEFMRADNVPLNVVDKLDTGKTRLTSDLLYAYCNHPVVKRLVQNSSNRARQVASITNSLYPMFVGDKCPSVEEAVRILTFYEESISAVLDACGSDKLLRKASLFSAFVLAHASAESKSQEVLHFIKSVSKGEMLESSDPAYTLREYLKGMSHPRTRADHRFSRASIDSQWVIFIKTLRALQASLTEEPLSVLRLPKGGSRQLIEWFIGDTATLVKQLRLGTPKMRQAVNKSADREGGAETPSNGANGVSKRLPRRLPDDTETTEAT
jgi:hypothetical protein